MGWTGVAVYSGAYQTGVDGRILEDDHTSGDGMVLDYLGNRTSDSEKDKKSRNCRFGGAGDRGIDHKAWHSKTSLQESARMKWWKGLEAFDRAAVRFFVSFRTYLCLYWSSVGDVSVFGEKVGDSACNSGSADLTFQVVCGRALSDGCAWWSCCRGRLLHGER